MCCCVASGKNYSKVLVQNIEDTKHMEAFLFTLIHRKDSEEIQVSGFKHAAVKIQQWSGHYLLTTDSNRPAD